MELVLRAIRSSHHEVTNKASIKFSIALMTQTAPPEIKIENNPQK